jgi:beta-mannosidase
MQIQTLTGTWQFRQAGTGEWLSARVPGGVHTDLLAAGRIPDPFVADNEQRVQWVAESDWEYRYSFACSPELLAEEQVWLVCDGLDTLSTIILNGQLLGYTKNMFRGYQWEIRGLLNGQGAKDSPQSNELLISFASPVKFGAKQQAIRPLPGVPQAIPGGPYLRKAPCQFGWDWGPQLPPIGIWKDIRLVGYSKARIEDVHLRQEHFNDQVMVSAQVSVQRWSATSLKAVVRLAAPDGTILESEAPFSSSAETVVRMPVSEPELWWPNGYGDQPLYQVEVSLHLDGSADSGPLDQRKYQLGLRTLELRQEEDRWGRSFVFVVNGVPIFAKGSNWIPADSFPTRLTDERLEWLIRSAADTHQNMLRVWGGGFYEDERFYKLCDRYGILIWQDFIFSCSIYPLNDPAFLENVRIEVVENVRRLRHHASLALWCGNNEMEQGWVEWNWKKAELQDLKEAYNRFFHQTLPEWCAAEDPDRSYWPSSPSSGTPFVDPNGQSQGDAHYWDVWHGRKPFTAYRDQFPRFMSEFGFQALPPLETIRTYAQEADWNMTSYIMEQHQKNASGNGLIIAQMTDNFRMPKDFSSMVYLSMVLQSEGIRYGVEHWRRNKERVAGTIYWQLNDCWPVASWSSLDYFGRWKALHYAARRFYAPLMLSIEDHPTRQVLYVTSDLCETWQGEIRWSLETLDGEPLAWGREPVNVAPYASTLVCSLDFSEQLSGGKQRELVLVAELLQGINPVAMQVGTFIPTKHLSLVDPTLIASLRCPDGFLKVDLTAQSLARVVEISLEGAQVVFSDNYFDLPAGRQVTVTCPLPAEWTIDQARQALKIRSIYDSYEH